MHGAGVISNCNYYSDVFASNLQGAKCTQDNVHILLSFRSFLYFSVALFASNLCLCCFGPPRAQCTSGTTIA